MTQLYLIRHAHTQMTGDVADRWSLSEKGRREAGILARQDFWRKVTMVLSSPEPKARQTARPAVRRWGIPFKVADCLHELRRPRLIRNYQQVIARFFSNPEQSIAGMETASQAAERITRCLKELVAAHPGQTMAVVSHGLVLTLFLAQRDNRWPTVSEGRAGPFTGLITVDTNTGHPIKNWLNVSEIS